MDVSTLRLAGRKTALSPPVVGVLHLSPARSARCDKRDAGCVALCVQTNEIFCSFVCMSRTTQTIRTDCIRGRTITVNGSISTPSLPQCMSSSVPDHNRSSAAAAQIAAGEDEFRPIRSCAEDSCRRRPVAFHGRREITRVRRFPAVTAPRVATDPKVQMQTGETSSSSIEKKCRNHVKQGVIFTETEVKTCREFQNCTMGFTKVTVMITKIVPITTFVSDNTSCSLLAAFGWGLVGKGPFRYIYGGGFNYEAAMAQPQKFPHEKFMK